MSFTARVQEDVVPVDGDGDLDLTEIIVWGEVTHDATGVVIAST